MNVALWVLLGAVTVGGCDDGGGGTTAKPVPLTEVGQSFVAAFCAKLFDCCPATLRSENFDIGTDEASCRQKVAAGGTALQAEISAAVAAGRATYDAAKMGQCLEEFATRSCEATRAVHDPILALASCRAAVHGTVSRGGNCASSDDCADGWCDVDGGFVCKVAQATGRPCDDDVQCASGQCDAASGTCVTATPDGLCTL